LSYELNLQGDGRHTLRLKAPNGDFLIRIDVAPDSLMKEAR
jgi:hypothetical protein